MNQQDFKIAINKVTSPLPGDYPTPITYKLSVKKRFEGLNIVDFFLEAVPRSTAQIWEEKIKHNNLKINTKIITKNHIVKAGDIASHTTEPKIEPQINANIQLIYNDDDILVIDKPSPLPVHASGRFAKNTLINILTLAFPKKNLKLVHRIDANTTGVVILAKNKIAANFIRQQFENKTIKKEYLALVEGIINDNKLNLSQHIGKEILIAGTRKVDTLGKKASTKIEVLERKINKNQTLLKVIPLTGRTNQIRLHLAKIGFPIVGDFGYKDKNYFINHPFTYPTDSMFLHAHQITITHPKTKNKIIFKAPIPEKFSSILLLFLTLSLNLFC